MEPSPTTIAKIAEWREKARRNELTIDEMREAIIHLRGERQAVPAAKSSRAKPTISGDDLLNQLRDL